MSRKHGKLWKIPKNELQDIVDSSSSMSDLMYKLGYTSRGCASYVKSCLDSIGIDYSKVVERGKVKKYSNLSRSEQNSRITRKLSNEELFVKDSKSFKNVRNRVISENLIPYKCAICGQEPFWNGKPMTLVLDHINGDHFDNRLDNLRFICRHCDSQLDTFCGRNHKNKVNPTSITCPICGNRKDYKAKTCKKCSAISRRKINITKEDLQEYFKKYDGNISKLSEKYEVTEQVVKVLLFKYDIQTTFF